VMKPTNAYKRLRVLFKYYIILYYIILYYIILYYILHLCICLEGFL